VSPIDAHQARSGSGHCRGGTVRYVLANYPERGWANCRCADLSDSGAVLVLYGPPWPRYESERQLVIEIHSSGPSGDGPVQVAGTVGSIRVTEHGWLRVEVEFADPNAEQHDRPRSRLQRAVF
jgi:hypothetical protein